MYRFLLLFALLLTPTAAIAQHSTPSGQTMTVSGSVVDRSTGETLIGATVYDMLSGK